MQISTALPTAAIQAVFRRVMSEQQGEIIDLFDDGKRIYIRSTVSLAYADVLPGDRFQGGVALRANQGEILLYPYMLRHVCTNGIIFAEAITLRGNWDLRRSSRKDATPRLRKAVTECCAKNVFAAVIEYARDAAGGETTIGIPHFLARLSALELRYGQEIVQEFLDRLLGARDRSPYGVMNAVTSLARDTEDPDLRWDLEVLGGEIATRTADALRTRWRDAATG